MVQRQFTREQLEARVAANHLGNTVVGQVDFSPQQRPQNGTAPYQPPPLKRDIQRAIYNAVYSAGEAISRREIAAAIGIKKTTWLETHIEKMVESRHLIRTTVPHPGINKYVYEVAR